MQCSCDLECILATFTASLRQARQRPAAQPCPYPSSQLPHQSEKSGCTPSHLDGFIISQLHGTPFQSHAPPHAAAWSPPHSVSVQHTHRNTPFTPRSCLQWGPLLLALPLLHWLKELDGQLLHLPHLQSDDDRACQWWWQCHSRNKRPPTAVW